MTIDEMRVSPVVRWALWAVLAIHVAAVIGYGPGDWFAVWYKRMSWCAGFMAVTVLITGDWLARRQGVAADPQLQR